MASTGIIAIVGTLLSIIVGLWKFFCGKDRKRKKRKKEGYDEAKEGLEEDDISKITAGVDDINNA